MRSMCDRFHARDQAASYLSAPEAGTMGVSRQRPLKVGLLGTWAAYRGGFLYRLLERVSPRPIEPVDAMHCDLLIVGPFDGRGTRKFRERLDRCERSGILRRLTGFRRPCVLMHLEENIRPTFFPADYVICSDFCGPDPRQIRFPYWMEMLDWGKEGFDLGTVNRRHGRLSPRAQTRDLHHQRVRAGTSKTTCRPCRNCRPDRQRRWSQKPRPALQIGASTSCTRIRT